MSISQPEPHASPLKPSAQRVQDALRDRGYHNVVVELPESTRTAAEAAAAVGCSTGQIAKSLVFTGKESGQGILVIASGANRVDERVLEALVGEKIGKADADAVRALTGFVIGGVPPLGHEQPLRTYIDADLLQYEQIWAAAGHPKAVFALTGTELAALTGGEVAAVASGPQG
jgi:prolyl-tRNA editing enzyme YbaK/EbsC (Cys-tRNA(Pro) deacylase)